MFLSLRTVLFRNLIDSETFIGTKNVFLVGENGQGKTNFLEAIYFCSYASSFRSVRDAELVQINGGSKDFCTEVKLSESINDEILVKFEKGKKSIFINKKRIEDRKDILSIAPCIIFCHEDMEFITGSPERRRWFFDQSLSLYDTLYLEYLRHFRRVLKSRNMVLKEFSQNKQSSKYYAKTEQILDALDPQFAMYGQKLMEKREDAVRHFSSVLCPLYEEVAGIEGITIQYIKSWKNINGNEEETFNIILSHLKERRAADMACGLSLSGPHRDRYVFYQNSPGIEFSNNASTGQRRLLALLLRVAQARRFSEMTGVSPILLLDDVLLEMDGEKRRKFLSVMPSYAQAFFTFLPDEPYHHYKKNDTLIYKVKDGSIFPE